jgi:acetyl-CoA carboxylase carboxyltransferase component
MASRLFDPGREGFLDGTINWMVPSIKAILMRSYTFNSAHRFLSQVTTAGGQIVATSAALTSKTATGGVARAADTVWPAVASGAAIPGCLIVMSSAVTGGADLAASAQRVIAWIEAPTVGLPLTPNGQDVTSDWGDADDPNGIFKL